MKKYQEPKLRLVYLLNIDTVLQSGFKDGIELGESDFFSDKD